MIVQKDDSYACYLGIHINQSENNAINSTQNGLTDRIVDALHLIDDTVKTAENSYTKHLPIN